MPSTSHIDVLSRPRGLIYPQCKAARRRYWTTLAKESESTTFTPRPALHSPTPPTSESEGETAGRRHVNVRSRSSDFIYFCRWWCRATAPARKRERMKKRRGNLHKPLLGNCALRKEKRAFVSEVRGWKQVCLQGLERKSFQRQKKKGKRKQEVNTEFWHLRQQTQLLPPDSLVEHLELVFKRLCRTQYITQCCAGFTGES